MKLYLLFVILTVTKIKQDFLLNLDLSPFKD